MNPEITQFDIIQSKLQQLKKTTPMLIYVITILDIALINFIMIVNINSCDFSIIVGVSLVVFIVYMSYSDT
jgi:hypothetical protein